MTSHHVQLFDSVVIHSINESSACHDAPSLCKWAVFELFSLEELVGRSCLGSGNTNKVIKKPFDERKMRAIRTAVFEIYPWESEAAERKVWMKCVEKVSTDVRYLLKVSLIGKLEWLQIGLYFPQ